MIPCQLIQFRYVKYHIFTHQFSTILRDKPVIIASPIYEKEKENKVLVVPHPFRDFSSQDSSSLPRFKLEGSVLDV